MNNLDTSLLAGLPPFIGLSEDELQNLLLPATSKRYEKGTHIFNQGEDAHSFFLLLDGHVRVVKVTPDGEQVIARYISSAEMFGIAKAIGSEVYPANAVAAVDCVALSWPQSVWDNFATSYPTFTAAAYATIGSRLQDAQTRIVEMATERVEQRVAHAVLKLASQSGVQTDEGMQIDFPISRQDISEMTGTTLHTVSRLLSSWEQKGMVKSGRQKITITEGQKLSLLAASGHNAKSSDV